MAMTKCELCGEPMPPGEEMFKFHGYSGNCPKPPLPRENVDERYRAGYAAGIEAAARICDGLEGGKYPDGTPASGVAWECAAAIREAAKLCEDADDESHAQERILALRDKP